MKPFPLFLGLIAFAGSCASLPNTADTPRDPRAAAWAAHDAKIGESRSAVPELLRIIADLRDDDGLPEHLACLVATDALVQLDAVVTARQAANLDLERTAIPSLVVLARNPAEHLDRLLRLHDSTEDDEVWRATGNLLAQEKAPGFAASLIAGFEIELEVTVVCPGQEPPVDAIGVGTGGAGGAYTSRPAPRDFPELPRYTLVLQPEPGDVLLADGPDPVYYRRSVMPAGRFETASTPASYRFDLTRLDWIEAMIGTAVAPLGFRIQSWQLVEFEGEASYREAVGKLESDLVRGFRAVVDRLRAKHALTKVEASELEPRIRVDVRDRREPWPGRLPSWRGPE